MQFRNKERRLEDRCRWTFGSFCLDGYDAETSRHFHSKPFYYVVVRYNIIEVGAQSRRTIEVALMGHGIRSIQMKPRKVVDLIRVRPSVVSIMITHGMPTAFQPSTPWEAGKYFIMGCSQLISANQRLYIPECR